MLRPNKEAAFDPMYEDEIESMKDEEKNLPEEISEDSVDWYLQKINALKAQNDYYTEKADKRISETKEWLDSKTKTNNNAIDRFTETLINHYRAMKEQDKNYIIDTPLGKITDRKAPDKWDWYDEKETISSLNDNDGQEFIKTKESLDKNALKKKTKVVDGKVVTEDGVVLEGVKVITPQERNIKLKMTGE